MFCDSQCQVSKFNTMAHVQDSILYVATKGAVRALDLDGNELWTHHLDPSDADINAGPAIAKPPTRQNEQPFVFFGTQGGSLHAIQARVWASIS
jgi:outer membrane protein assembly factor BamB